jgi:hypothetical protein
VYQSSTGFGLVCQHCLTLFSPEDIELILHVFFIFGGYFSQYPSKDFSLRRTLKELNQAAPLGSVMEQVSHLNLKLLHNALVHGITPAQYIGKLRRLLKDEPSMFI